MMYQPLNLRRIKTDSMGPARVGKFVSGGLVIASKMKFPSKLFSWRGFSSVSVIFHSLCLDKENKSMNEKGKFENIEFNLHLLANEKHKKIPFWRTVLFKAIVK